MMNIKPFQKNSLRPIPWKNGGGVTREIATSAPGSAYWRMSIADVDRDGTFSLFPGLCRILTVIAGNGMQLMGNEQSLNAAPLSPVKFSGEENIHGQLLDGPVQNFNLIFDPQAIDAQVLVGSVSSLKNAIGTDYDTAMIYCVAGTVRTVCAGLVPEHSGVFIRSPTDVMASNESDIGLWVGMHEKAGLTQSRNQS